MPPRRPASFSSPVCFLSDAVVPVALLAPRCPIPTAPVSSPSPPLFLARMRSRPRPPPRGSASRRCFRRSPRLLCCSFGRTLHTRTGARAPGRTRPARRTVARACAHLPCSLRIAAAPSAAARAPALTCAAHSSRARPSPRPFAPALRPRRPTPAPTPSPSFSGDRRTPASRLCARNRRRTPVNHRPLAPAAL
nr:atherin-like [Aegilops tauschii subsp. strangulata]